MTKRSKTGGETVQLSIRLPIGVKEQIDKEVEKRDLDFTTWIRHACREKLERDTNPDYSNLLSATQVYAMIEKALSERENAAKQSEKMLQRV